MMMSGDSSLASSLSSKPGDALDPGRTEDGGSKDIDTENSSLGSKDETEGDDGELFSNDQLEGDMSIEQLNKADNEYESNAEQSSRLYKLANSGSGTLNTSDYAMEASEYELSQHNPNAQATATTPSSSFTGQRRRKRSGLEPHQEHFFSLPAPASGKDREAQRLERIMEMIARQEQKASTPASARKTSTRTRAGTSKDSLSLSAQASPMSSSHSLDMATNNESNQSDSSMLSTSTIGGGRGKRSSVKNSSITQSTTEDKKTQQGSNSAASSRILSLLDQPNSEFKKTSSSEQKKLNDEHESEKATDDEKSMGSAGMSTDTLTSSSDSLFTSISNDGIQPSDSIQSKSETKDISPFVSEISNAKRMLSTNENVEEVQRMSLLRANESDALGLKKRKLTETTSVSSFQMKSSGFTDRASTSDTLEAVDKLSSGDSMDSGKMQPIASADSFITASAVVTASSSSSMLDDGSNTSPTLSSTNTSPAIRGSPSHTGARPTYVPSGITTAELYRRYLAATQVVQQIVQQQQQQGQQSESIFEQQVGAETNDTATATAAATAAAAAAIAMALNRVSASNPNSPALSASGATPNSNAMNPSSPPLDSRSPATSAAAAALAVGLSPSILARAVVRQNQPYATKPDLRRKENRREKESNKQLAAILANSPLAQAMIATSSAASLSPGALHQLQQQLQLPVQPQSPAVLGGDNQAPSRSQSNTQTPKHMGDSGILSTVSNPNMQFNSPALVSNSGLSQVATPSSTSSSSRRLKSAPKAVKIDRQLRDLVRAQMVHLGLSQCAVSTAAHIHGGQVWMSKWLNWKDARSKKGAMQELAENEDRLRVWLNDLPVIPLLSASPEEDDDDQDSGELMSNDSNSPGRAESAINLALALADNTPRSHKGGSLSHSTHSNAGRTLRLEPNNDHSTDDHSRVHLTALQMMSGARQAAKGVKHESPMLGSVANASILDTMKTELNVEGNEIPNGELNGQTRRRTEGDRLKNEDFDQHTGSLSTTGTPVIGSRRSNRQLMSKVTEEPLDGTMNAGQLESSEDRRRSRRREQQQQQQLKQQQIQQQQQQQYQQQQQEYEQQLQQELMHQSPHGIRQQVDGGALQRVLRVEMIPNKFGEEEEYYVDESGQIICHVSMGVPVLDSRGNFVLPAQVQQGRQHQAGGRSQRSQRAAAAAANAALAASNAQFEEESNQMHQQVVVQSSNQSHLSNAVLSMNAQASNPAPAPIQLYETLVGPNSGFGVESLLLEDTMEMTHPLLFQTLQRQGQHPRTAANAHRSSAHTSLTSACLHSNPNAISHARGLLPTVFGPGFTGNREMINIGLGVPGIVHPSGKQAAVAAAIAAETSELISPAYDISQETQSQMGVTVGFTDFSGTPRIPVGIAANALRAGLVRVAKYRLRARQGPLRAHGHRIRGRIVGGDDMEREERAAWLQSDTLSGIVMDGVVKRAAGAANAGVGARFGGGKRAYLTHVNKHIALASASQSAIVSLVKGSGDPVNLASGTITRLRPTVQLAAPASDAQEKPKSILENVDSAMDAEYAWESDMKPLVHDPFIAKSFYNLQTLAYLLGVNEITRDMLPGVPAASDLQAEMSKQNAQQRRANRSGGAGAAAAGASGGIQTRGASTSETATSNSRRNRGGDLPQSAASNTRRGNAIVNINNAYADDEVSDADGVEDGNPNSGNNEASTEGVEEEDLAVSAAATASANATLNAVRTVLSSFSNPLSAFVGERDGSKLINGLGVDEDAVAEWTEEAFANVETDTEAGSHSRHLQRVIAERLTRDRFSHLNQYYHEWESASSDDDWSDDDANEAFGKEPHGFISGDPPLSKNVLLARQEYSLAYGNDDSDIYSVSKRRGASVAIPNTARIAGAGSSTTQNGNAKFCSVKHLGLNHDLSAYLTSMNPAAAAATAAATEAAADIAGAAAAQGADEQQIEEAAIAVANATAATISTSFMHSDGASGGMNAESGLFGSISGSSQSEKWRHGACSLSRLEGGFANPTVPDSNVVIFAGTRGSSDLNQNGPWSIFDPEVEYLMPVSRRPARLADQTKLANSKARPMALNSVARVTEPLPLPPVLPKYTATTTALLSAAAAVAAGYDPAGGEKLIEEMIEKQRQQQVEKYQQQLREEEDQLSKSEEQSPFGAAHSPQTSPLASHRSSVDIGLSIPMNGDKTSATSPSASKEGGEFLPSQKNDVSQSIEENELRPSQPTQQDYEEVDASIDNVDLEALLVSPADKNFVISIVPAPRLDDDKSNDLTPPSLEQSFLEQQSVMPTLEDINRIKVLANAVTRLDPPPAQAQPAYYTQERLVSPAVLQQEYLQQQQIPVSERTRHVPSAAELAAAGKRLPAILDSPSCSSSNWAHIPLTLAAEHIAIEASTKASEGTLRSAHDLSVPSDIVTMEVPDHEQNEADSNRQNSNPESDSNLGSNRLPRDDTVTAGLLNAATGLAHVVSEQSVIHVAPVTYAEEENGGEEAHELITVHFGLDVLANTAQERSKQLIQRHAKHQGYAQQDGNPYSALKSSTTLQLETVPTELDRDLASLVTVAPESTVHPMDSEMNESDPPPLPSPAAAAAAANSSSSSTRSYYLGSASSIGTLGAHALAPQPPLLLRASDIPAPAPSLRVPGAIDAGAVPPLSTIEQLLEARASTREDLLPPSASRSDAAAETVAASDSMRLVTRSAHALARGGVWNGTGSGAGLVGGPGSAVGIRVATTRYVSDWNSRTEYFNATLHNSSMFGASSRLAAPRLNVRSAGFGAIPFTHPYYASSELGFGATHGFSSSSNTAQPSSSLLPMSLATFFPRLSGAASNKSRDLNAGGLVSAPVGYHCDASTGIIGSSTSSSSFALNGISKQYYDRAHFARLLRGESRDLAGPGRRAARDFFKSPSSLGSIDFTRGKEAAHREALRRLYRTKHSERVRLVLNEQVRVRKMQLLEARRHAQEVIITKLCDNGFDYIFAHDGDGSELKDIAPSPLELEASEPVKQPEELHKVQPDEQEMSESFSKKQQQGLEECVAQGILTASDIITLRESELVDAETAARLIALTEQVLLEKVLSEQQQQLQLQQNLQPGEPLFSGGQTECNDDELKNSQTLSCGFRGINGDIIFIGTEFGVPVSIDDLINVTSMQSYGDASQGEYIELTSGSSSGMMSVQHQHGYSSHPSEGDVYTSLGDSRVWGGDMSLQSGDNRVRIYPLKVDQSSGNSGVGVLDTDMSVKSEHGDEAHQVPEDVIHLTPELAEKLLKLKEHNAQLVEAEAAAVAMQIPLRLHVGTVTGMIIRLVQNDLEAKVLEKLKWLDERGAASAIADEDEEAIILKSEEAANADPELVQALRDQKRMRIALKYLHTTGESIEMNTRTSEAIQRDLVVLHLRLELNVNAIEQQLVAVLGELTAVIPARDQLANELDQLQSKIRSFALHAAKLAHGLAESDSLEEVFATPIAQLMQDLREIRLSNGSTEEQLQQTEFDDREECVLRIALSEAEKDPNVWSTIEKLAHLRAASETRFAELSEYAEELNRHHMRLEAELTQLNDHLTQVATRLRSFVEDEISQNVDASNEEGGRNISQKILDKLQSTNTCIVKPNFEVKALTEDEFDTELKDKANSAPSDSSQMENPNSGISLASLYVHTRRSSRAASSMAKDNRLLLHKMEKLPDASGSNMRVGADKDEEDDIRKQIFDGFNIDDAALSTGAIVVNANSDVILRITPRRPVISDPIRVTPRRIGMHAPKSDKDVSEGGNPEVSVDEDTTEGAEMALLTASSTQSVELAEKRNKDLTLNITESENESHISTTKEDDAKMVDKLESKQEQTAKYGTEKHEDVPDMHRGIADFASPMSIDSMPIQSTGNSSTSKSSRKDENNEGEEILGAME